MQVLAVDIGTGTQDIFLYDSRVDIENGFKLVVPSPTMMVYRRIRQATARGRAICLTGVTMGGGPSHWAAEDHLKAGLAVFATPDAARSFNDDLAYLRASGVEVISEDEVGGLPEDVLRLELRDFDFPAIERALSQFDVYLTELTAVAVAAFDHGAAPPEISDRTFRFDYLDRRIREAPPGLRSPLSAFAYRAEEVPPILTRLQAVVSTAGRLDVPLMVMDTAPAAVLGATFEDRVAARPRRLMANVGNFHTLAFRLGPDGIEGVFEHHTGLLDREKLGRLLSKLAEGTLPRQEIFDDSGHGALIYSDRPLEVSGGDWGVAVTGPRRGMMRGSSLRPHFPAPFGDMMMTGCFGLLAAAADLLPGPGEAIYESLRGVGGSGTPPWEI